MRTLLICSLLFLAACQQPSKQNTPANADVAPPIHRPWTEAFAQKSMLFADEIVIEGPEGTILHAGVRVEPDAQDSSTRTTKDGLLQDTHVKPGAQEEIHAFLDNWELIAFQRITILERVVPCEVHIRARGDARFVDQTTKKEQSGAELSFEGKIPR